MTSKELRQIERENAARAYSAAHFTMLHIRDAIRAHKITLQEARTLRGQALAGDVEEDAPHVPDVEKVISNLRIIRTWASTGASKTVVKALDDALALIEAQQKTLDEIDKYVRELDKAVNGK